MQKLDAEELARAMSEVAQRPEFAASLREQSIARAREFSWDRTARRTHEVYEEARKRWGSDSSLRPPLRRPWS